MRVGRALDERRDPIRSSEAAAKLLKENHEKLGSWPLAITAYNHGIAGLLKARKRKGSEEAVFSDYSTRRFKFASRNFYTEFLAARHVAKNFEQSASAQVPMKRNPRIFEASRQEYEKIANIPGFNPFSQPFASE